MWFSKQLACPHCAAPQCHVQSPGSHTPSLRSPRLCGAAPSWCHRLLRCPTPAVAHGCLHPGQESDQSARHAWLPVGGEVKNMCWHVGHQCHWAPRAAGAQRDLCPGPRQSPGGPLPHSPTDHGIAGTREPVWPVIAPGPMGEGGSSSETVPAAISREASTPRRASAIHSTVSLRMSLYREGRLNA